MDKIHYFEIVNRLIGYYEPLAEALDLIISEPDEFHYYFPFIDIYTVDDFGVLFIKSARSISEFHLQTEGFRTIAIINTCRPLYPKETIWHYILANLVTVERIEVES